MDGVYLTAVYWSYGGAIYLHLCNLRQKSKSNLSILQSVLLGLRKFAVVYCSQQNTTSRKIDLFPSRENVWKHSVESNLIKSNQNHASSC
jgi:hypothetical protein